MGFIQRRAEAGGVARSLRGGQLLLAGGARQAGRFFQGHALADLGVDFSQRTLGGRLELDHAARNQHARRHLDGFGVALVLDGILNAAEVSLGLVILPELGYEEHEITPQALLDTREQPAGLRALTEPQLAAAAGKFILPERLVWVIVGDLRKIEPKVRALGWGEVTVLDNDGKPVR